MRGANLLGLIIEKSKCGKLNGFLGTSFFWKCDYSAQR